MTKILVIDDDAIVRMTVEHILRDAGYEVLTAENGLRGMAVFRSEQPDLVIKAVASWLGRHRRLAKLPRIWRGTSAY